MGKTIAIVLATILAIGVIFVTFVPAGHAWISGYSASLEKAEKNNNYAAQKKAEDGARSIMVQYNTDKGTYELYRDYPADSEQFGWAQSSRIRVNASVNQYNEYMQKNSFIWAGNIPKDLPEKLFTVTD